MVFFATQNLLLSDKEKIQEMEKTFQENVINIFTPTLKI